MTKEEINKVKIADTLDTVHDLIKRRWSPRSYLETRVPVQDLHALFEAARWAASSGNEQPWRFIYATKDEPAQYQRFLDILLPGNQIWAKLAPVLIVMAAKRTTANGDPNYYALHDTGQALAHLMLQATALGLHAHGMAGFDHEKARQELHIPDDFAIAAAVAVGYEGELDQLSEKHQKAETAKRTRQPLSNLVFLSEWNNPAAF